MDTLADYFPEETAGLKEALMKNDSVTAAHILKNLTKQNNIPLNIGITGESGSGKSSFVNAFRGINNSHEDAAPTGCIETTSDIRPYPLPDCPNVTIWDLPGVGTMKFPAHKYLKDVRFRKFDFFIIISDTRFRENDVKLALEIQKMGKKFYFVRSKIDNDMRAEQRNQRSFHEEASLAKIRQNCLDSFRSQGFESPQVFLLSSFEVHRYDFSLLHKTFQRELPALRRRALLFTAAEVNLEIINEKKEAFQAEISSFAFASAAGAAVPVPGLSIAVDAGLMVTAIRRYTAGFGLDVPSLQRLAANMGVLFEDLKAVIRSPLAAAEITQDLILKVLSQVSVFAALAAIEEGFSFIPIFGTVVAMGLSSFTTSRALNHFLDMLADDAQRVFQRALGL